MKFFNHSIIRVCTYHEDGSAVSGPADESFSVRSLGRGRWYVECEDGFHTVMRTSFLQKYFRPHRYADGYHSSGEPIYAYEEVQILKA